MIFSLIACFYITAICWSWGMLLFLLLKMLSGDKELLTPGFSVTCFSGLALVAVLVGILSLFIPLGFPATQAWLIIPALALVLIHPPLFSRFKRSVLSRLRSLHPAVITSLSVSILLAFIMSAGEIIHPDSLHYHAQCIQWIEKFPVIPGLVNLGYHFGLQSSWFTASAMFSFPFTGSHAPTFLNSAVITWFIIFLHERIQHHLSKTNENKYHSLLAICWLLLFVFSYWSFTQVRATLSSSSPDFIVTMYIWLVFFLFIRDDTEPHAPTSLLLILFLGLFSITIKLSAVPVALFATFTYLLFTKLKSRSVIALLLTGTFIITPFITRNVVSSGYPLFPSAVLNIFPVDWKAPQQIMSSQSAFIKAYARVGDKTTTYGDDTVNRMALREWLPIWWRNRALSNKIILAALILLFLLHIIFFRQRQWKLHPRLLNVLLFSIAGIVFWFKEAPDPRFGFGYLIPVEAVFLYLLIKEKPTRLQVPIKAVSGLLVIFSVVLAGYAGYRVKYFFKKENFFRPEGIAASSYQAVTCNGITFHVPSDNQCGSNPIPCIYYRCGEFLPRGKTIRDGFKPANALNTVR